MPPRSVKKPDPIAPDHAAARGNVAHFAGIVVSEHSVGTALRETYYAFCRSMTKRLAREGITLGMWFVLRELWNEDGLSQGVIAKRTGTQAPSVVNIVNTLEREGLVRRSRTDADRRVSSISLTREGKTLEARLTRAVLPVNREALDGFSRAETATLLEMLGRLRTNIGRPPEDE